MNIYLCFPIRTAIGTFQGSLSSVPATTLAATLIKEMMERSKLSPDSISEVILGSVIMAGQGQAPARQAVIRGGLPATTQAMTINKVCSSGLKAIMLAANEIHLGNATAIIAGGMENMSLAPYLLPSLRNGSRLGHTQAYDSLIYDALWDVYHDYHMGNAAEVCAKGKNISRQEQDEYAIESYKRAQKAIADGVFKQEIVPIKIQKGKDELLFDTDEEPGKANIEKIPSLKPVFDRAGTVTAANASSINDGASIMLVCSEEYLNKNGITPFGRILSHGWFGQDPEWFTTSPIGAIESALSKANKKISDIDLFEINEAFSVVALACQRGLDIPHAKLNITGGAVALGHPVGASGARILTTLLHNLKRLNKKLGTVGICNGGGEATAMVVEAC